MFYFAVINVLTKEAFVENSSDYVINITTAHMELTFRLSVHVSMKKAGGTRKKRIIIIIIIIME